MKNETILEVALNKLDITATELKNFSDHYNNDFSVYGNEVYEDIKVRLVHLDNFLKNNWWNNRFYFLWRDFAQYKQIIDIGFSVPYLPIHLAHIGGLQELPSLIYVDGNDTSKKLGEIILKYYNVEADFVTGDIQNEDTWKIVNTKVIPGKKLFTAFETLEHLPQPKLFWKEIHSYKGSELMLSLPIGEKIPSHHSFFADEQDVIHFLESHLDICEKKVFDGKSEGSNYKIFTAVGIIK
jgi:hypothetical protein